MALPNGELQITPLNPQHAYPVDKRMQADTLNSRDSISPYIRWRGMQVHVLENDTTYMLKGGVTNEFWTVLGEGSGGGGSTFVGQFATVDLLPATSSSGDYAYVGDSENFLQYNWDNIAGKWVSNATNLSPEKFYTSMVANGPALEKVVFTKTLKDEVIETDGAQVIYPAEMKNFIFTGSGVVLQGVGYADEENEFSAENRTDGILSVIINGGVPGTEFAVATSIPVGGKKAWKGNGTTWDEVIVNNIAFSNSINSVNSDINIAPDGLSVVSHVLDSSTGQSLEFKEKTTWFDGNTMSDVNVDDIMFKKVGAKYFFASDAYNHAINVERFRLDDDDHATIQRAFDFIASSKSGYSQFFLRIPSGRKYNIDQPLLLNTHSDVFLVGDGWRKSSLNATATMDAMVVLGNGSTTPFVGRCYISGITFNAGGLASCCLNAIGTRYSLIEKNEFVGLATNGEALRINGWVQVINRNLFSNNEGSLGLTAIRIFDGAVSNNVTISSNSISSYSVGLKTEDISNSVNIVYNSFDNCDGTGIYIAKGARGTTIENNYFEACGDTGLTITKGAPGASTELWKGAILAHHNYLSAETWINGLIIKKNQFSNCSDINSGVITLSGLDYCIIDENFSYHGYNNKYFVDLRWEGSRYATTRNVKISHTPTSSTQFESLVGLNADSTNNGNNNLIIVNKNALAYNSDYSIPVFNNPFLWNTSTSWNDFHEDENTYKGNRIWNYRGNSVNTTRSLTINTDSTLTNKYFRVNWYHQSDVSTTCTFTFKVDGVTKNTVSSTSSSSWAQGGRNATIYIPSTASTVTFEFSATSATVARKISGFSIVPAHYDINDKVTLGPTRLTSDNYIVGGSPEGFQKAKSGRLAIDIYNGKVYKKTTSYDTVTGWVEVGATKATQTLVNDGLNDTDFVTPLGLANSTRIVGSIGTGLLTTDGTTLVGVAKDGAIVKNVVTGTSVGFPVTNADVRTFNGANLQRSYSILKDRDTNDLYIQSYDGAGLGLGWVKIGSTSYIDLTDTTDTTLTNKAFFVPSVSAFETGITLENPAIFRPIFTINDTTGSAWTASAIGDAVQLIRIEGAGGGTLAGAAGMEFKKLTIMNESASTFTLLHEDTGTTATDRFNFADSNNLVLPVNGWVDLMYVNGRYRRGL